MLDESQRTGQPLAATWLNCKLASNCYGSGSMNMADSRGGQTRFDVLENELIRLQEANPGQIAVISFSSFTAWQENGRPILSGGSTNMADALNFVKRIDGMNIAIVVISDGEPDDPKETLRIAKTFETHIDTIYVGPEHEREGRDFLRKLSEATGGKHQDDFTVDKLADRITFLLGSGS